MTVKSQDI